MFPKFGDQNFISKRR